MPKRVLILGGTTEARDLASELLRAGHDVTTSFAGVTESPVLPDGKVRTGGFGGIAGLVDYLRAERVDLLVDATHPFAAVISSHAAEAARLLSIDVFRLERPAWRKTEGDRWVHVTSMAEAVEQLPRGAIVLVTTGRKSLEGLLARQDLSGVIRSIEALPMDLPSRWISLRERPPFTVESELGLMQHYKINTLLTKNAGGSVTEAKLVAARRLGLPVVMIERPVKPPMPTFSSAKALLQAVTP